MRRRPPIALALALVVISIATLAAPRADAICGGSAEVDVVPFGDGIAPINTHVWVTLGAAWETIDIACARPSSRDCAKGQFDLVLRTAPTKGAPPEDIATTRRELRSLAIATVELVPSAPLRARTRYDVWYVEEHGATRPRVVGTFTTGSATDITAPTWNGIVRATSNVPTQVPGKKIVTMHVECEADGVDVDVRAPTDDMTPPAQMRYVLWIEDVKAKIDYVRTPLLYEAAYPIDTTAPPRFEINLGTAETRANWEIPKGVRAVKIGVRAIDLAGNVSVVSEVVVKL